MVGISLFYVIVFIPLPCPYCITQFYSLWCGWFDIFSFRGSLCWDLALLCLSCILSHPWCLFSLNAIFSSLVLSLVSLSLFSLSLSLSALLYGCMCAIWWFCCYHAIATLISITLWFCCYLPTVPVRHPLCACTQFCYIVLSLCL